MGLQIAVIFRAFTGLRVRETREGSPKICKTKYEMGILKFLFFFLAFVRETSFLLSKILLLCAIYECCVYLFLLFSQESCVCVSLCWWWWWCSWVRVIAAIASQVKTWVVTG
jgi:hypothetical protein